MIVDTFGQIYFWEKNLIDLDQLGIVLTTDGDYPTDPIGPTASTDLLPFLRNRKLDGIWSSTKTGPVSITVQLNGLTSFDSIMLVDNNFLTFDLTYEDKDTGDEVIIASKTANSLVAPVFSFPQVESRKVYLKNITQQVDPDTGLDFESKRMGQFIITRKIFAGALFGYPKIKSQMIDRSKKFNRLISGKFKKVDAAGAFNCKIQIQYIDSAANVTALQRLFNLQEGILSHLNLSSTHEFWNSVEGYRPFDYYLVSPNNNFAPTPLKGVYEGMAIELDLVEVV